MYARKIEITYNVTCEWHREKSIGPLTQTRWARWTPNKVIWTLVRSGLHLNAERLRAGSRCYKALPSLAGWLTLPRQFFSTWQNSWSHTALNYREFANIFLHTHNTLWNKSFLRASIGGRSFLLGFWILLCTSKHIQFRNILWGSILWETCLPCS